MVFDTVLQVPRTSRVLEILFFDPLHPGVVFLTTDGGAYRSQDNGIIWQRIASGYADM